MPSGVLAIHHARRRLADALRAAPPPAPAVLISIRPHYAELILDGRKTIEFRRRFSADHQGTRAFFYVTSPVRAIVFSADLTAIERAAPRDLWRRFGRQSAVTRGEFEAYFAGCAHGVAIALGNVLRLPRPLPLHSNAFHAPQSYCAIPPALARHLAATHTSQA